MISLKDIITARECVSKIANTTPMIKSTTFSRMTNSNLYLKLENLQRTGSFKIRGAFNKIQSLNESQKMKGVITASAGNHAQGVALAAAEAGTRSTIVMPVDASISKLLATIGYGANVIVHGKDYAEAYQKSIEIKEQTSASYIHAFDDPLVIAGQGTIGLEILDSLPAVDTVVVGVGGGGLISGIATAIKEKKPNTRIIGVQPEGAPSAVRSLKDGRLVTLSETNTIADGLATRRIGELTFTIMSEKVDDVITVSDSEIARTILLLLERAKLVAEGAGAAALAACLSGKIDTKGKNVVALVSGGNIDANFLDKIINIGLARDGRILRLNVVLDDKPGQLKGVIDIIAEIRGNIRSIAHDRSRPDLAVNKAEVGFEIETRGPEHRKEILEKLEQRYRVVAHELR